MKKILFLLVCMVMTLTANAQEKKMSNFNYNDVKGMWCSVYTYVGKQKFDIDYEDVIILSFSDKVAKDNARVMAISFTNKEDAKFVPYKLNNGIISVYQDSEAKKPFMKLVIKKITDGKLMIADVYINSTIPVTMEFCKYKEM